MSARKKTYRDSQNQKVFSAYAVKYLDTVSKKKLEMVIEISISNSARISKNWLSSNSV